MKREEKSSEPKLASKENIRSSGSFSFLGDAEKGEAREVMGYKGPSGHLKLAIHVLAVGRCPQISGRVSRVCEPKTHFEGGRGKKAKMRPQ